MSRQRRPPISGAEGERWPGELDLGRSPLHPVLLRSPRRAGDQRRALKRHDPLQSWPARRGTGRRGDGSFSRCPGCSESAAAPSSAAGAGGLVAYVPAAFVSRLHPRVLARARRLVRARDHAPHLSQRRPLQRRRRLPAPRWEGVALVACCIARALLAAPSCSPGETR